MNRPLESAFAVAFLICGLSHMVQPKAWSGFFIDLFQTRAAAFAIAMYTLPIGLLLVFAHNYWAWDWSVLLTIYGWASLLKGSLYFLYPQFPMKFAREKVRVPRHFAYAGAILMAVGGLLAYDCVNN